MRDVDILTKYERLKSDIEDKFTDIQVPPEVQFYYLLAELICERSFASFANQYGHLKLSPELVQAGKNEWRTYCDQKIQSTRTPQIENLNY